MIGKKENNGTTDCDLAVVMIAHQEHERIGRSLNSVRDWVSEINVVVQTDDDPTIDVARRHGARVLVNPWTNYAQQKNVALGTTNRSWILQLDADEVVSDALRDSIIEFVAKNDPAVSAASFAGVNFFYDRWLRHGSRRSIWNNRLVRKGCAKWQGGIVHEHLVVTGQSVMLDGLLKHYSMRSTAHFEQKSSRYADLFVAQRVAEGLHHVSSLSVILRPAFRFLRSYVMHLGFLDGFAGFLYARFLSHYTFIRYNRLREYSICPDYRARIDRIIAEGKPDESSRPHGLERLLRKIKPAFRRGAVGNGPQNRNLGES